MTWRRRPLAAVRRASLTLRFGVFSAVVMMATTAVLLMTTQDMIADRARNEAVHATTFISLVAIEPVLAGTELSAPLSPELRTELDAVVAGGLDRGVLRRIKIFDRQHRLVYSDDPRQVGRQFLQSTEVRAGLAGQSATKFPNTTAREHQSERGMGVLLEVFLPLELDGDRRPDGVVEIYIPYAPVQATIEQDTRHLLLLLVGAFSVLWVVLVQLVARASRRLQRELDRNKHQALHDALTGLPNRTLLFDRVERALVVDRRQGTRSAVLLLDLDGFKEVNDTLGHHNGDVLLVEVSRRFAAAVRESDSLVRLGGDEFAVLLTGTGGASAARDTATRLLQTLDQPVLLDGAPVAVTASVGIALAPLHGDSAELLLQRADVAMYAAKAGHEPVVVYTPEHDTHSSERLALLGDLRRALAHDELLLHYQPKADASTGATSGVEALVRWQHPTRGLVPPDQFIPLAEQTGLICELTQWVLRRALETDADWRAARVDLPLSVNISARDLADRAFPGSVAALLTQFAVPRGHLTLEITETSLMSDPATALSVLRSLEQLGVRLSIDDYGSGYSSLAYVQQLPVDELKIDRSLLRGLAGSDRDRAIVRSTVELGHSLGLHVVAEGVEDARTWDILAELDCDLVQGYLLSRPMPAEQVLRWVASRPTAPGRSAGVPV